jgi:hypothetical protein
VGFVQNGGADKCYLLIAISIAAILPAQLCVLALISQGIPPLQKFQRLKKAISHPPQTPFEP